MPHHIVLAPLAVIYALLIAVCGLQSTAIVLAGATSFAVLAYAFVPPQRPHDAAPRAGSRIATDQGD